jgi:hypothetical protein
MALTPRKPELLIVGSNSLQWWAEKINGAMADSVAAIIATGQAFIDAKIAVGHGQFERLFANHADPLENPVKCTSRTAQMLMKIAGDPILSNTNHGSVLPPSWRTLYELSTLPPDKLQVALDEHWIRPEMQRKDVAELKGNVRRSPSARSLIDDPILNCTEDIRARIEKTLAKLDQARQYELFFHLQSMIGNMERRMRRQDEGKSAEEPTDGHPASC